MTRNKTLTKLFHCVCSSMVLVIKYRKKLATIYCSPEFWSRNSCILRVGGMPLSVIRLYVEQQTDVDRPCRRCAPRRPSPPAKCWRILAGAMGASLVGRSALAAENPDRNTLGVSPPHRVPVTTGAAEPSLMLGAEHCLQNLRAVPVKHHRPIRATDDPAGDLHEVADGPGARGILISVPRCRGHVGILHLVGCCSHHAGRVPSF